MIITTTLFTHITRYLGSEISYNRALFIAKRFKNSALLKSRSTCFWSIDKEELWNYLKTNYNYSIVLNNRKIDSFEELYERTMQYLGEEDGIRAIHNKEWRMASYNPNNPKNR